jgi:Uma2 family endonuclease
MATATVGTTVDDAVRFVEADLDGFPRDGKKYEIIDGSLHVSPAPIDNHNDVCVGLVIALRAAKPAGWRVLHDVGVRCGSDSNFIPDFAALKPDTISGVNWHDAKDFGLVGEVESPSTRRYDRSMKAEKYAAAGIPSYWRVELNVDGPTLHVHELAGDRYDLAASVKSGDTWEATLPFPVVLDPAAWRD